MEAEAVNKNLFEVVIGSLTAAITFIMAWLARNTIRANKYSELMAANIEGDKKRDEAIQDIKGDVYAIKQDVESMKLALIDWKETNNNTLIRVNKVLEQLGE
jgi:hypothetical protein